MHVTFCMGRYRGVGYPDIKCIVLPGKLCGVQPALVVVVWLGCHKRKGRAGYSGKNADYKQDKSGTPFRALEFEAAFYSPI